MSGEIGVGHEGMCEPQLGGLFEAFLPTLDRTDFTAETDFTEYRKTVRQRLVFDG